MSQKRSLEDKRRLEKLEKKNPEYMVLVHTLITGRKIRGYPYSTKGNRAKYYRTICNKKVRKLCTDLLLSRGQYKKAFDIWWQLF